MLVLELGKRKVYWQRLHRLRLIVPESHDEVGHESQRDSLASAALETKRDCTEKSLDAGHVRLSGLDEKPRGRAEHDESDRISHDRRRGLTVTRIMVQD